jgi:hypothetical protein
MSLMNVGVAYQQDQPSMMVADDLIFFKLRVENT